MKMQEETVTEPDNVEPWRLALGMFVQGMAYYTSFPDSKEDAEYNQKQATYWFLYARNVVSEKLKNSCAEQAKKYVIKNP